VYKADFLAKKWSSLRLILEAIFSSFEGTTTALYLHPPYTGVNKVFKTAFDSTYYSSLMAF
jgi:hypothetical protein